jgi:multiple sugar transport system permease protein
MAVQQSGELKDDRRPGGVRGWWDRNQRLLIPYIFIAPNLVVFTVFVFVPILFAFYMSLNEWSLIGSPVFVGLGNYVDMLQDQEFLRSLYNTGL